MNSIESKEFDPIVQLESMLKNWQPDLRIDLHGVVLDFIYRSKKNLYEVLKLNYAVYEELFNRGAKENKINFLMVIVESEENYLNLLKLCDRPFPIVAQLLNEIWSSHVEKPVMDKSDRDKFLMIAKDATVIWQLSDIHFGKLNVWLNDPKELSSAFVHTIGIQPLVKPDFILISGDITTGLEKTEFEAFTKFCKYISTEIWGENVPQRILVVPGNHDIRWDKDGTVDHLAEFAKSLNHAECCIIPFGEKNVIYTNPDVEVWRFGTESETAPPLALVLLKDAGIEIVLLVSSFFSGVVSEEFQKLIGDIGDLSLQEKVIKHVREDSGTINMEYLSLIARSLRETETPRLALIHHHLVQYGSECSQNRFAFALLKTLFSKGIRIVLHGHLHMFEDSEETRAELEGQAYCIPCSTVSSHTWRRSPGFMVHLITKGAIREMITFTWELSSGNYFNTNFLRPEYKVNLSGGRLNMSRFPIKT